MDPTPIRRHRWLRVACAMTVVAVGACSGDEGATGNAAAPGTSGASRGAELYEQSCASCHGSDLRGTERGPSHLSQVYAPDHHPDESFRAAITRGAVAHHWDFGDMPPVPGLDDEEIELIIAHVREQQQTHGLEPYPPE